MNQLIGSNLGNRYEIIEILGTGGMAVVYKGRDLVLNRMVAIKVLKQEFSSDEEFVKKFQKESQAAASLSHPNIVNVFDVGYNENVHYIVMEIVNGNTLRDYLNNMQGFMKEEAIINIGLQIASALSQAHQNDIVHRDIKSQNILINEQGSVKVTDFGIARAATTATIVNTKEVIGSVHYSSPEQARGGFVDARSDIYSLGILLYELATKTLPFEGDSPVTIALKQIKDDMPNPQNINSNISDGLSSIIHKCTEKMQNDRYQSVLDLIEDLKELRGNKAFIVQNQMYNNHETTVLPIISEEVLLAHQTKHRQPRNTSDEEQNSMSSLMPKSTPKSAPQKNKMNMTLAILAALALAVIVFGVFAFSKFQDIFDVNEVNVPGVVGLSTEEAVRTLKEAGLNSDVSEQRVHNEIEAGFIISQSHEEGDKVKEGFTIKLVVSSGGIQSIIPNVKQQTLTEARVMIENDGFVVGEVTYAFNDLPEDMIINQTPKAGIKMPQGTVVDLVVSQGLETDNLIVPSLETKTIREAESTLNSIGLKLGEISYEISTTIEKGLIISNSKVGTEVEPGTFINVVVSSGETEETTEASTEATTEAISSELRLLVPIETDKFLQDSETIKIEMVQGDVRTIVYEKVHSKSEGPVFEVQCKVSGTGNAKILVYYGEVVGLEQDIQF
jgi:serine/threonine-protein kinase